MAAARAADAGADACRRPAFPVSRDGELERTPAGASPLSGGPTACRGGLGEAACPCFICSDWMSSESQGQSRRSTLLPRIRVMDRGCGQGQGFNPAYPSHQGHALGMLERARIKIKHI